MLLQDIQTLKERTQKGMEGGSFTGFEVLAGHTWQHLIKARGIALDCKLKLGMAVDGRKQFNPPLPQGYFGTALQSEPPVEPVQFFDLMTT